MNIFSKPNVREVNIPLDFRKKKGDDHAATTLGYYPTIQDGYLDEDGSIKRRPGFDEYADTSTAARIDGLFNWTEQGIQLAISNKHAYDITSTSSVTVLAGDAFAYSGYDVSIANYGNALYLADGGLYLYRIDPSADILEFDYLSGTFTAGNQIYGATSGAYATISEVSISGTTGFLVLTSVSGTFQDDEIIYEATYSSEYITDSDNQNFADGTINEWVVYNDGTGVCEYEGTDPGAEKVMEVRATAADNTYLYGSLPTANMTAIATLNIIKVSASFYLESGNTCDDILLGFEDMDSATANVYWEAQSKGQWLALTAYVRFYGTDFTGSLVAGFYGAPANGDIVYVDDISVKKVTNAASVNGTIKQVVKLNDTDIPSSAYSVVVLDKYLLANSYDTGYVYYSAVGNPLSWDGSYIEAEAKGDNVKKVIAANLELYLFGSETLEVWRDDGVTPFVRETQGYIESGTVSRYTPTLCGNELFWIDNRNRLVKMPLGTRTPIILSETLNAYLQQHNLYDECTGEYVIAGGKSFYIINSAYNNFTIAWDIKLNRWYEWGWWNSTGTAYEEWEGTRFALVNNGATPIIGHNDNGKVYALYNRYMFDDADTIRTVIRTPSLDFGAPAIRKISHQLVVYARVDDVTADAGDDSMNLSIRWRDNGSSTWGSTRTLILTATPGGTHYVGKINRNGNFYNRQYEIVNATDIDLTIMRVSDIVEFCYS